WPAMELFARTHQGPLRALAGAGLCIVGGVVLSCVVLFPAAWILWFRKVAVLARGHHVNHLSLRGLAALEPGTWDTSAGFTHSVLRIAFVVVSTAAFFALTVRALRGRKPLEAALIGLLLVPVVFYPANYYFHFVFLLP